MSSRDGTGYDDEQPNRKTNRRPEILLARMNSSRVPPTNNHQVLPRVNDSAGLLGGVAASTITDAKAAVAATRKNAVR